MGERLCDMYNVSRNVGPSTRQVGIQVGAGLTSDVLSVLYQTAMSPDDTSSSSEQLISPWLCHDTDSLTCQIMPTLSFSITHTHQ